ncbi:MAG: DUF2760 domain-containing protein [Pseudomonadota bacterium]
MDIVTVFSRKAFIRIFLYLALLGALVYLTLFYGVEVLIQKLPELKSLSDGQPALSQLVELLMGMKRLMVFYIPFTIAAVFLFAAVGIWMGLRQSAKTLLTAPAKAGSPKPAPAKTEPVEDKAQRRRYDRQMFLYLMSVLQREGRLIDFLTEDLSLYEDAQIGAAVRGIHENCKKVIEKTLSPKPVLDTPEGDSVTIEAGFDPGAIKLIGNVRGEPPFKGVLRHRGWQTKKEELPTLSGTQDAGILSPAEVEIQ